MTAASCQRPVRPAQAHPRLACTTSVSRVGRNRRSRTGARSCRRVRSSTLVARSSGSPSAAHGARAAPDPDGSRSRMASPRTSTSRHLRESPAAPAMMDARSRWAASARDPAGHRRAAGRRPRLHEVVERHGVGSSSVSTYSRPGAARTPPRRRPGRACDVSRGRPRSATRILVHAHQASLPDRSPRTVACTGPNRPATAGRPGRRGTPGRGGWNASCLTATISISRCCGG